MHFNYMNITKELLRFYPENLNSEPAPAKAEYDTKITEPLPSKDNKNVCVLCGKKIPRSNMSLHEVYCEKDRQHRRENNVDKAERTVNRSFDKKTVKKGAKKSENTCKRNTFDEDNENAENLDKLLAEFKRKDSQCAVRDCKKSILTLGQKCRYCLDIYCLGHHFPEVHGCTQAAKEHARSGASGPGQVSQKAAARRGHLERKLDNKIKDMGEKRKSKTKGGK